MSSSSTRAKKDQALRAAELAAQLGVDNAQPFADLFHRSLFPKILVRNSKVVAINVAAAVLFDLDSEDEVLGGPLQDLLGRDQPVLVDLEDSDSVDSDVPVVLELGPEKASVELFHRHLDDGFVCLEMRDVTRYQAAIKSVTEQLDNLAEIVDQRSTELVDQIRSHQNTKEKLRMTFSVVDHLTEAVVLMDTKFKTVMTNPSFYRICGQDPSGVRGLVPSFIEELRSNETIGPVMQQSLQEFGIWQGEFWSKRGAGDDYAASVSISTITDNTGTVQQYCAVLADITQRKQDEEQILFQANYDTLTALPNRTLFLDRLNHGIADMTRSDHKLALLFLDLDGFKVVNDTLGHDRGDDLLQEAANRLVECARAVDTVARLGGDEFTLIMPGLQSPESASIVAQRILDNLTAPFYLDGQEAFISASIGITIFPDDAIDASELLKNADAAMYRAKERGKNNYQFFTTDLNEQVMERLVLKTGLVNAIPRSELSLHYQPKLDIASHTVTGVEALMRWQSRELGFVSPTRFIPILEETGMVVEVGEWALRTACEQHRKWREAGLPPVSIAVNLSVRQLREPTFVERLLLMLSQYKVEPQGIEIEVTESMLMSDAQTVVESLKALHANGIKIAMDDFGTGYSSLSYLKKFPIDIIKIDRSFVNDIAVDNDDAEIIKAIINMGQTLNRKIVAEGVETEEQLGILKDYACDEIQGYFFAKPMPGEQVTDFLSDHFKS